MIPGLGFVAMPLVFECCNLTAAIGTWWVAANTSKGSPRHDRSALPDGPGR
jgi:hypothetical protein